MPPGIKPQYDSNDWWAQTKLIVYNQIREHEEFEILQATMSVPRL